VSFATGRRGILARCQPARFTGACARRIMVTEGADQAGLQRADLHMLCVDADKWPNLLGIDPRLEPEAAWRWMLSILGAEFATATVSCWWSSSCCVRAGEYGPLTLSAKLFFYLDRALGETEAVQLLKRADMRVRAYFEAVRNDPSDSSTYLSPYLEVDERHKLVDHRVAFASQLIYIAPPSFLAGISDPLAGCVREALLIGKRATLSVAGLLKSLPALEHARVTRSKASARPTTAARMPKARSLTVQVPGQVIPLAAAAREIAAMRAACQAAISGTDEQYRDACDHLYQRRIALEMLALAGDNGGLAVGGRNDGALMISSAIAASMPITTTIAQLRKQTRDMLRLVVSEEWIDAEWEGRGDMSVIRRFEMDVARGEGPLRTGKRYTYSKPRLLEEWRPTQDHVDRLGLMSLCSEAQRSASRRAAKKQANEQAETPKQAAARKQASEVQRLQASGLSLREIVAKTGLKISTVNRRLTAPAAPVIVAAPVVSEAPDAEVDAAVELALVRGDDYADVLASQLGFTVAQVRAAMHRLGHPELLRPAGLALAA